MSSSSIFAVPVAAHHGRRSQPKVVLKRKRNGQHADPEPTNQDDNVDHTFNGHEQLLEYSAVVTPIERVQRRLAGLPIDQLPPYLPFPHAPSVQNQAGAASEASHQNVKKNNTGLRSKTSLHLQHLSVMTAVLHRFMMSRDYVRASRALGLLLRNEVSGHAIDVRSEGLWGIGAEILYRSTEADITSQPCVVTREGFQRAKLFYERLVIQYPQHRTWPDAVNELDFCIALFSLWVCFATKESQRLAAGSFLTNDDDSTLDSSDFVLLEAKRWEHDQAKQIADAMDTRMRNVPFISNHEMMRLRAMVALWTADVIDLCIELIDVNGRDSPSLKQGNADDFSAQIERMVIDVPHTEQPQFEAIEAETHRSFAHSLLQKLETPDELES